jgi:hypothetical protein
MRLPARRVQIFARWVWGAKIASCLQIPDLPRREQSLGTPHGRNHLVAAPQFVAIVDHSHRPLGRYVPTVIESRLRSIPQGSFQRPLMVMASWEWDNDTVGRND